MSQPKWLHFYLFLAFLYGSIFYAHINSDIDGGINQVIFWLLETPIAIHIITLIPLVLFVKDSRQSMKK